MHYLTFALTMEASEDFAFSGPKARNVSLPPVSREAVGWNILPVRRGLWLRPGLTAVDTYFNKKLKVLPGEGAVVGKEGHVMVWAGEV